MNYQKKIRREVVKEIRRRYSHQITGVGIPKKSRLAIIKEMRVNSAYVARMRGISNESWEQYAIGKR